MSRRNHPEDPLAAYQEDGAGYAGYLQGLREIYEQLRVFMRPAAHVVLEVSNIKSGDDVTPLAWDVAAEISRVLVYRGERIVVWDATCYGFDHSYCLFFQVPSPGSRGPTGS